MIHRFGPQRHSKKALNSWNPWQDHSRMHTVYVSKWLLQRRSRGCCIPLARWEHDPLVGDTRLNFSAGCSSRSKPSAVGESDRADLPSCKGNDVEAPILACRVSTGSYGAMRGTASVFPKKLDGVF